MDDSRTETIRTDVTTRDEQRELAARLRRLADRLDELPGAAAPRGLSAIDDQARVLLQRAERVIAGAIWAAAAE